MICYKRKAVALTVHTIKNNWFQQKTEKVELRILFKESGACRSTVIFKEAEVD